ncbi:hypothetical protein [Rufibacter soli]
MKRLLLVVALLASMFSSCGDEEVVLDPVKMGQAYYPLEVGSFWVYNVTETTYKNNVPTKVNFQTRELVKGIYKDQTGKEWHTLEISKRLTASNSWVVIGSKTISKTVKDVQVQENNRTTVFMVFPVAEGKEWNPNAYNKDYAFDEESQNQSRFKYQEVGATFERNGKSYPNTVKVIKTDSETLLALDKQYEQLALETGPVFRSSKVFTYCSGGAGSTCEIGEGYIVSGTERAEELDSTGKI